jgi:hypothetical protein
MLSGVIAAPGAASAPLSSISTENTKTEEAMIEEEVGFARRSQSRWSLLYLSKRSDPDE